MLKYLKSKLCVYYEYNDKYYEHNFFPCGSDYKESACNAGDLGLIPWLGRSPEQGMDTRSSILAWRIPTDRRAWRAVVHGVTESDMTEQLSTAQHNDYIYQK